VTPPEFFNPKEHRCPPHPQARGSKSDDAAAAADAGEDEWADDDPEEIHIDESEVCVLVLRAIVDRPLSAGQCIFETALARANIDQLFSSRDRVREDLARADRLGGLSHVPEVVLGVNCDRPFPCRAREDGTIPDLES